MSQGSKRDGKFGAVPPGKPLPRPRPPDIGPAKRGVVPPTVAKPKPKEK